MIDRFRACLLGGALGDALGYPLEFLTREQIAARFGTRAPDDLTGNVVSDDTQMTLFTAEGLILARAENKNPISAVHDAYKRWLATQDPSQRVPRAGFLQDEPRLFVRRAPGNTCLSALTASMRRDEIPDILRPINNSKGCGAVMRSAPFGLIARDRKTAFESARDAGALTHGHPSGYLSAACFASIVFDVLRDMPLDEAMNESEKLLVRGSAKKLSASRSRARSPRAARTLCGVRFFTAATATAPEASPEISSAQCTE